MGKRGPASSPRRARGAAPGIGSAASPLSAEESSRPRRVTDGPEPEIFEVPSIRGGGRRPVPPSDQGRGALGPFLPRCPAAPAEIGISLGNDGRRRPGSPGTGVSSGGSVSNHGGGGLLGVGPVVHGDVQGGEGGGVPADVGGGWVRGAAALPRDVDRDEAAGGRPGGSALRADGAACLWPLRLHGPLQSWREAQSTIARAVLTASRYWASSTASAGPGYRVRVA